MKKILLTLIISCCISLPIWAQQEHSARIEALKIAYLTRKLNLSTEEAQKFWPVYNKYADEVRKMHMELRNNNENEIDREEKVLNLRKKFNSEFGKALNDDKVNAFFKSEKEFNGMVQREMMERRQQRMENRAGGKRN